MLPVGRRLSVPAKPRVTGKKFSPKRRKTPAIASASAAAADAESPAVAPHAAPVASPAPVEASVSGSELESTGAKTPTVIKAPEARKKSGPTPVSRPKATRIRRPTREDKRDGTSGLLGGQRKLSDVCSGYRTKKRPRKAEGEEKEKKVSKGKKATSAKVSVPGSLNYKKAEAGQRREAEKQRVSGKRLQFVNGRIVLDEASLEVATFDAGQEDQLEVIHEENTMTAKYSSFQKRTPTDRWTVSETKKFFQALQMCGTDFTMMLPIFPHRNRKQLKMKWRREEKMHPKLVTKALKVHSGLDTSIYEENIGPLEPKQQDAEDHEQGEDQEEDKKDNDDDDGDDDEEEEEEDEEEEEKETEKETEKEPEKETAEAEQESKENPDQETSVPL
mmetsp:Transcript_8044/g.30201  ORF Transcript_8044/g.30201 Transcript_8044/m.30201 type:complete len:389 (-) Transcript_8044:6-1172(-)